MGDTHVRSNSDPGHIRIPPPRRAAARRAGSAGVYRIGATSDGGASHTLKRALRSRSRRRPQSAKLPFTGPLWGLRSNGAHRFNTTAMDRTAIAQNSDGHPHFVVENTDFYRR